MLNLKLVWTYKIGSLYTSKSLDKKMPAMGETHEGYLEMLWIILAMSHDAMNTSKLKRKIFA